MSWVSEYLFLVYFFYIQETVQAFLRCLECCFSHLCFFPCSPLRWLPACVFPVVCPSLTCCTWVCPILFYFTGLPKCQIIVCCWCLCSFYCVNLVSFICVDSGFCLCITSKSGLILWFPTYIYHQPLSVASPTLQITEIILLFPLPQPCSSVVVMTVTISLELYFSYVQDANAPLE